MMYQSDEDKAFYEDWTRREDAVGLAISTMQYDKVLDACEDFRESQPLDSNESIIDAIQFLRVELESRVKLMYKVAKIAIKHPIEEMRFHERVDFLQRKLRNCHWRIDNGGWTRTYGLGYFSQGTRTNVLCYPVYLLRIRRAKNMYSQSERAYMRKWGLAYIPSWINVEDNKPIWKKKWKTRDYKQYLGEDGTYSGHNKGACELTPWERAGSFHRARR